MEEQIAKITGTNLGLYNGGVLVADLTFDYGGACQGLGAMVLDDPDGQGRRVLTAQGVDFITGILKACGAERWEHLKGRTVIVLRDPGWNGLIRGIKPLPTEEGEAFTFADAFEKR